MLRFFVQVEGKHWLQDASVPGNDDPTSDKNQSDEADKGAIRRVRSRGVGRSKHDSVATLLDYLVVRRHDISSLRHKKLQAAFHLSQGAVGPQMAKYMFTYLMELLRSEEGDAYGTDLVRYLCALADQWPERRRELFDLLEKMLGGVGPRTTRYAIVGLQCIQALGHR